MKRNEKVSVGSQRTSARRDRVVLRAEIPRRGQPLEEAVVLERSPPMNLRFEVVGERQVHGQLGVAAIEVADIELDARTELIGRAAW